MIRRRLDRAEPVSLPMVRMQPRRAMVVDEDPRIRSFVQSALGQFEPTYQVVSAATSAEAVEWSESKGTPDLVLIGSIADSRWAFHYGRHVTQSGGLVALLSSAEDAVSSEWRRLSRPPTLSDLLALSRDAITGTGFLEPVESAIS
jgi:DNA-binding NarL/FixJ family response regulator